MNHYKFPEIHSIDDVLPHIEGRDEFKVSKKDGYTVINYVVAFQDTFDMENENDLGGAIRRECRGLIFWPNGELMSRPFHKFFNVGEREETQHNKIDMSQPHEILEKEDGSMIRPIIVDGKLRLATKMGITDISVMAEKCLDEEQRDWLEHFVDCEYTPILELVSPQNRIVVEYKETKLVMTALRENDTGDYINPSLEVSNPFEVVKTYGKMKEDFQKFLDRIRKQKNKEGIIIRFSNGHMLKSKNDWYVDIHKLKELLESERHAARLILDNELDDAIAKMPKEVSVEVLKFEKRFEKAYKNKWHSIESKVDEAIKKYGNDRKRIAMEWVPENKDIAGFVFGKLDGKDISEMFENKVISSTSKNIKFEKMMEWLEQEG